MRRELARSVLARGITDPAGTVHLCLWPHLTDEGRAVVVMILSRTAASSWASPDQPALPVPDPHPGPRPDGHRERAARRRRRRRAAARAQTPSSSGSRSRQHRLPRLVTGPGAGSSRSFQRVRPARRASSTPGRPRSPLDDLDRLVDLDPAEPVEQQRPGHARQAAARERRGPQLAVDDVEHVGSRALAQVPGEVGEHRLGRPRLGGQASATTFSAYDVVLRPASAPARCAATAR